MTNTDVVLHEVRALIEAGAPSGNDLDSCDEYYRKLHAWYSSTIQQVAHFKIFFAKETIKVLTDQKYKLTSAKLTTATLQAAYVYSINPIEARQYEQLMEYQKLMIQIMKDYQTLISAYKEERGINNPKQN